MRYQELVVALSDETRYTRREIRTILRTLVRVMTDALAGGMDVRLLRLGKLENVYSPPRSGRNQYTGERFVIPAKRRIKFVPSSHLRARVLESAQFYEEPDLSERFGLPKRKENLTARFGLPRKGKRDEKVRSGNRPEQGSQGEEGGGRR